MSKLEQQHTSIFASSPRWMIMERDTDPKKEETAGSAERALREVRATGLRITR